MNYIKENFRRHLVNGNKKFSSGISKRTTPSPESMHFSLIGEIEMVLYLDNGLEHKWFINSYKRWFGGLYRQESPENKWESSHLHTQTPHIYI